MNEAPLTLSDAEVRAVLDGRKTQIRIPIKGINNDTRDCFLAYIVCPASESGWIAWEKEGVGYPEKNYREFTKETYKHGFGCPLGNPGDRLWLRETYAPVMVGLTKNALTKVYVYRADKVIGYRGYWFPPRHMPRSASRITLEVLTIRPERLMDITEAGVIAEGFTGAFDGKVYTPCLAEFLTYWNKKYPRTPAPTNPWVWAGEFDVFLGLE